VTRRPRGRLCGDTAEGDVRRFIINAAAGLSFALLMGGCASSTATNDPQLPLCDGSLTVTVTQASTTPIIAWSPACLLNRLTVQDAGGPPATAGTPTNSPTIWELAPPTATFGPPVQFGIPPRGIVTEGSVGVLQAGHSYTVSVSRAGGEAIILSFGSTTFGR